LCAQLIIPRFSVPSTSGMPRSDDIEEAGHQEGLLEDMQRALPEASPSTREVMG